MLGPRKIPTLLAIVLVIAIIAGVSFLFEYMARGQTRASVTLEPKQVTVTNITESSFSFVWETEEPTSGGLLIQSADGKKYSAFDERDATGKLGKYRTHSVTVKTLIPSTKYTVTILSNGKKYPIDSKAYEVVTFPSIDEVAPGIDPAYGSVFTEGGTPAEGAIVFLRLADGQLLSAVVRNSGSWIIPLGATRVDDGSSYLPVSERMTESITVKLGIQESQVQTDTLNDAPVPDITLGNTYDFRGRDAKKLTKSNIAVVPKNSKTSNTSVLGTQTTTKTTSGSITLTQPAEGATLTSNRPLISGIGIPGKKVTVTLGSATPIVGTTTVGSDGLWRYTPSKILQAGKQTVTMTTVDAKKKPVAITHTFTVLKSGTQVLGDATPSGELTETPTPTEEATDSATPTEEATDTSEPMPTSGSLLPTLILLILGTTLFLGGGVVFFIK